MSLLFETQNFLSFPFHQLQGFREVMTVIRISFI